MLKAIINWIRKLFGCLSKEKGEEKREEFITIGDLIPIEIKIKLYEMVS
ncbi:MAG TPA: hypothetical protein GXX70_00080 [Tepidimicrobium sp.]|nr:hypothetical protein [Tepidimicrobium sp.]